MIDPLIALAFAVQSNKGIYALLLGSGVSRAAQIPTGWEVVLDLVEKLAHTQGEKSGPDATEWYRQKYGKEPDYSKLLDALAKSREERQQLLRSYFEPSEDEREQEVKIPTDAHRSIARLVAKGYIRVIVTTNFDRLIERAIEDEGITPTVISTPDAVEGTLPLTHQRCCVVKVHGDYLDTRIKNTPKELEKYDRRVNKLLDRILDEFGLIVCGWSADWDAALRAAFERCKSRRFTLFWASRGKLGDRAGRLVNDRRGTVVPIENADRFFAELSEKVLALEDMQQPHPLSVAAAAATVKRLLSEERHRIRLHDLVRDETERVFDSLQPVFQGLLEQGDHSEKFATAIEDFKHRLELLRIICLHGAYWGKPEHHREFVFPIQRLACDPKEGQNLNESLRTIPAVIMLYTAGLAALARDNIGMLVGLLTEPSAVRRGETEHFLRNIDWVETDRWFKLLPAHKRQYFPASEWLSADCRELLRQTVPADAEYERIFDRFEILRSVIYVELTTGSSDGEEFRPDFEVWGPPGRFVWKLARRFGHDKSIFDELRADSDLAEQIAQTGLFQRKSQRFVTALGLFEKCAAKMAGRCL